MRLISTSLLAVVIGLVHVVAQAAENSLSVGAASVNFEADDSMPTAGGIGPDALKVRKGSCAP